MTTSEDNLHARQLHLAPGPPGSARLRYAAAMYFNRLGTVSDDVLEVYRICSPLDDLDPNAVLLERGLTFEVVAPDDTPVSAIRSLLYHADLYLSGLSGDGIAEVRAGLAQWRDGLVTAGGAKNAVVQKWLGNALSVLAPDYVELANAIAQAAPHINWITYDGYPIDDVGAAFMSGHAYASIIGEGTSANQMAKGFDFGLFLIAPHILYRDHMHMAPELYAPLTGPHGWRFGTESPLTILPAHSPVWNEPFAPHLTKVGPVPFLCFFGWTRDVLETATIIRANDWEELERLRLPGYPSCRRF